MYSSFISLSDWCLPGMAASRYGYFPLWLLPVMAASRYGYFPLWLLPVMATSRYGYFPLWLLPIMAASRYGYFPLWLLPIGQLSKTIIRSTILHLMDTVIILMTKTNLVATYKYKFRWFTATVNGWPTESYFRLPSSKLISLDFIQTSTVVKSKCVQ